MKYAYDLHIHSVLSPCGDVLMTPNNIFNMANLKGLNIISITDHNSMKQLTVCETLSHSYDLLWIPGVEITVAENFDVLCYFKTIKDALIIDGLLEKYLPKIPNTPDLYGEQSLCDIDDNTIESFEYLLINPLNLSLNSLIELLAPYPHIMVYAHIDKPSRSGIAYLDQVPLDGIEYRNPKLKQTKTDLHSSDAHQITDILEVTDDNQIDLDELTIDAFFRYFGHD